MKQIDYDIVADDLIKTAKAIENAKRPAYCIGGGEADTFKSFDIAAEPLAIPREKVLAVHLIKHMTAILAALGRPEVPQAEEIKGRFADAINYLKLGYAMLVEKAQKEKKDNA
jgi:hypothetical protein